MNAFQLMQAAVDIAAASPHPDNKIAATLAGTDKNGDPFTISKTNHWPDSIARRIGTKTRIGNSSGTIHAETDCILHAPGKTENASLYTTDPPCPNCMKNIAEAGIAALYIDHKGFEKDFARRRGEHFEDMSLKIAEKAGINTYILHRKEQRLEPLLEIPKTYQPQQENPPDIEKLGSSHPSFLDYIKRKAEQDKDQPFATAFAHNISGQAFSITASAHPTIGYTRQTLENKQDKYSFILQPINRILMIAARHGLKIDPDSLYSSRCPTSRELVNMVGADLTHLQIGDYSASRDGWGIKALARLQKSGILTINSDN